MTGQNTGTRTIGAGTVRIVLFLLFLTALLVLLGIVAASTLRFAENPGIPIEIGLVRDFPPSDQPYVITSDGTLFFIVNTGGELIAHYQFPLHQRPSICRLQWISDGDYFTEGCYGTKFNLDGSYFSGPPATMPRYPLVVEDGKVFIDLTRTIPGPELEEGDF